MVDSLTTVAAGSAEPTDPETHEFVARKWAPVLAARTIVGSRMLLAGICAFIAASPWVTIPETRGIYQTLLLCLAVVQTTILFSMYRDRSRTRSADLVVMATVATCAFIATAGTLEGRTETVEVLIVAYAIGCAGLMPWSVLHQAALAFGGALAIGANAYAVHGSLLYGIGLPRAVSVSVTLLLSVYISYELARRRMEAGREELARIRAEEALQALNARLEQRVAERTAEIEAANESLRSFSASVSHDLRAPVRAIGGLAHTFLEDFGEQLTPEAVARVTRIHDAAGRMQHIIESLLRLAQVVHAPMKHERVDLSEIARSVGERLAASEPTRRVQLEIQPGARAHGDAFLLELVLENLLSNAWKFTRDREVARIEFGVTLRDGLHVYSVRDNGVGFDPAAASRLFGAFERLHAAEGYEGTGIGLTTVERIIQRHGGTVWAESVPGSGATFSFTLAP
ncbi:MAG TPA: ATP-binding protein [Candidatus Limnocylindrales bacterium]|nr:ATP-binding protein [Candidatus Limnocylindrales bacterium]